MREKIYISKSSMGIGVFAKAPIAPRETIFYLNGRLIDFAESVSSNHQRTSIQIGIDRYVSTQSNGRHPDSPARYLNHACSPNAGFIDEIRLIALNSIRPGDEIRFDYSTTMLERYWELDCHCGSTQCRGRIRDFDLLPVDLQTYYVGLGIVSPFILQVINGIEEKEELIVENLKPYAHLLFRKIMPAASPVEMLPFFKDIATAIRDSNSVLVILPCRSHGERIFPRIFHSLTEDLYTTKFDLLSIDYSQAVKTNHFINSDYLRRSILSSSRSRNIRIALSDVDLALSTPCLNLDYARRIVTTLFSLRTKSLGLVATATPTFLSTSFTSQFSSIIEYDETKYIGIAKEKVNNMISTSHLCLDPIEVATLSRLIESLIDSRPDSLTPSGSEIDIAEYFCSNLLKFISRNKRLLLDLHFEDIRTSFLNSLS